MAKGPSDVSAVSVAETDAIIISRMLTNDDCSLLGAGLREARAGALLAGLTHAPAIRLAQGLAWLDFADVETIPAPHDGVDLRDAEPSDAVIDDYLIYDDVRRLATFFVISGLQVDRHGNTNLLGEPDGDGGWRRRGPGAIGTTTMATLSPRVVIHTRRHTPAVFVPLLDVCSALGWGDGSTRERLGVPTPGPEACITPAGIFDYPGPHHEMRLVARRPEWSPRAVARATGFPVHDVDTAPEIEPPRPEEIEVLRTRVDVHGVLHD